MPFGASFFPCFILFAIDKEEKMKGLATFAATLTLAVVLSFVLVSTEQALPAWAEDNNSRNDITIVEPGRTLFGKSYNQLAGELSNWSVAEPEATNVAFDPDGRFCHLNQKGKVWFLAGTWLGGITERTCEVPAGKAIFFALDSWVSFPPEFPEEGDPCADLPTLVEQIRCDVNEDLQVAPYLSLLRSQSTESPLRTSSPTAPRASPGASSLRSQRVPCSTSGGLPQEIAFLRW